MILHSVFSSLTRTTSSGRMIPALDGLRCIAILAVIMHHLGGYVAQRTPGLDYIATKHTSLYKLIDIGNCGVQLFFVISGFIVALPFAEHYLCGGKAVPLGKYFWRRLVRLHPPYLINLLLMTALLIIVKRESWSDLMPHLAASLFYVHNLVYHSMSIINGVAWSLEIEIQFYLLVPWLALVYRIRDTFVRRGILLAATVAMVLAKTAAGMGVPHPLSGSVLYYLDYFFCGLLLADWYTVSANWVETLTASNRLQWDILGIAAGFGCVILPLNSLTWHLLPVALLPACAATLRGSWLNWLLSRPAFVVIGGMCYTIYLYHFLVVSLLGRFIAPATAGLPYAAALALQSIVILPAILVTSALLFRLIERPFMTSRTIGRHQLQLASQPA